MRTRPALPGFAILLLATAPASGQPATGLRTSLVINEVMPDHRGNRCPWIELKNPTGSNLELTEFALRFSDGEPIPVADAPTSLERGEFFVMCFRHGSCAGCADSDTPTENVVEVQLTAVQHWTSSGEAVLSHDPGTAHAPGPVPVDYVSWGRPGLPWSEANRSSLWPEGRYVRLAESFGASVAGRVLAPGASIGLYPGSRESDPNTWVVFDPDERSRGRGNPVPKPKAFTLPAEATVGTRSFSVGWARRPMDDEFEIQVSRDPRFRSNVYTALLTSSSFRLAERIPQGRWYYQVAARSGGSRSAFGALHSFSAVETRCDWHLPRLRNPELPGEGIDALRWLMAPRCSDDMECNTIDSMRFKFQRKDSFLHCGHDPGQGQQCATSDESYCLRNAPQPHCATFGSPRTLTSYTVCADDLPWATCEEKRPNPADVVQFMPGSFVSVPIALHSALGLGIPTQSKLCDHGLQYCAEASVSMLASAYDTCLSQDRIAYQLCKGYPTDVGGLCHGEPISNDEVTEVLKWAFKIPNRWVLRDPDPDRCDPYVTGPNFFFAATFEGTNTPAVSFRHVRDWIDADRPMIGRSDAHYHTVMGYCVDPELNREWVYVFDPNDGPRIRPFDEWLKETLTTVGGYDHGTGLWVGPPTTLWATVRADEDSVWDDTDGDGWTDFDEIVRCGSDPNDSASTP